jgi:hypothetical protein
LVFVALLLDAGLSTLKYLKSQKPVFFRILGIVLIIILLGQMLINNREYNKYVFLRDGYKKNIESSHIPAGIFLKHNVPSNEWLIVIHDTGAIPYNSGLKTIDFSRLNNETLAQKQFDSTEIVDYFYSINAGAVVITSYDWEKIHQPWIYGDEAAAIARDPRFANYQLIKKYRTDISPDHPSYLYYEFLFLRKDLAFALKTKDDAF